MKNDYKHENIELLLFQEIPFGLVVRRSHRRGPASIPGVGSTVFCFNAQLTRDTKLDYLNLEPGFPSDRALRADTCNF